MKKKQWTKRTVAVILCMVMVFGTTVNALALTVNARSALLINANSGQVLLEQNADEMLVSGSMTKVMTIYILLDQIRQGYATLDTQVSISRETAALSKDKEYSNIPFNTNQTYTLNQLLEGIVTASACAASKAVAEHFAGSESAFVPMMNHYAYSMGLNASYADSSGISKYNYITARSMAILAKRLITDFPMILEYTKKPSIQFEGKTYNSTNKMLEGMPQYAYGVDGLKTGYINESKYCFTGTSQVADVRLISVVMGANKLAARFDETKKMLDYGFALEKIQMPWVHAAANPTIIKVKANDVEQSLKSYLIEENAYINLRDLAYAFQDTAKNFNVEWDAQKGAIMLTALAEYTPLGNEMSINNTTNAKDAVASNAKIYLNQTQIRLKGYHIDGNSYFKLRDIGTALNFPILWDDSTKIITVTSN